MFNKAARYGGRNIEEKRVELGFQPVSFVNKNELSQGEKNESSAMNTITKMFKRAPIKPRRPVQEVEEARKEETTKKLKELPPANEE